MIIHTSFSKAEKIYPTWVSIKSGEPIAGHNQYRANIEVTEFKTKFSKDVWNTLIQSGRKNLANYYATDVSKNQRLILFNGKMEYDESTEKGRKFAKAYGNKLAQIDDYKFLRYAHSNPNIWWEACIQDILKLIGDSGWVEINSISIKGNIA